MQFLSNLISCYISYYRYNCFVSILLMASLIASLVASVSLTPFNCEATHREAIDEGYHKKSSLEKTGDILQIVNPIIAAGIASQEKGIGHFGIVYGQAIGIMLGAKLVGKNSKWQVSKRPSASHRKKVRFDGFPSGHTTSAWTAASYIRVFSEDHKMLSMPLYASAALTGYSRVKARAHTSTQVLTAIVLSEAVTMINSKLEWNNNYRSICFDFSPNGAAASLQIHF